eukprot:TRINITY_DN4462_c0_g1_i3.p1 TRINITY_DN4462_c0_g1~~TRINITY_DN4462_c0_g1_i3.p1  ORF type:complete len:373 (-),score=76.80 TRINITY_DN4462_c0_g1_i3:253-1371(-)
MQMKSKLAGLERESRELEGALVREGLRIPNDTHPDVPVGDETKATVLRMAGEKRTFEFVAQDHLTLGTRLDIIDFHSAAKTAGQKFYYLTGDGAMLELALTQWAMSRIFQKGYRPVVAPDMVHSAIVEGCGFQPRGEASQTYAIEGTELCLSATAEMALAGMFADTMMDVSRLPMRLVGYSHCFRRETGGMGSASKGLYRVHQFSKVEMFIVSPPDPALAESLHAEMLSIQEELFSSLGLHYRVLDMPTEDLGASAFRKYDVEAWMPGRKSYGEISSTSNCTDYQSRRLNIRCKGTLPQQQDPTAGAPAPRATTHVAHENRFVYTLNGTGCAVPRMIVAIMETFQNEDGSVTIPEPLRQYMGGKDKLLPIKP